MKLYNPDGSVLMTVTSLDKADGKLLIKGDIFGTMPVNAELRPADARAGLKLLSVSKVAFLLSLLIRKK